MVKISNANNKVFDNQKKGKAAKMPRPLPQDPFMRSAPDNRLSDPLEPVNRIVFQFNDKLYLYGLRPAAKVWYITVPKYGRQRVQNFFHNLDSPVTIVSSLFQGKIKQTGYTAGRFAINTTVGVGGLFDPAGYWLKKQDNNFNQTFSAWNIAPGPYLVLPFFGPTTTRGAVGLALDNTLYPINYAGGADATAAIVGTSAFRNTNSTSLNLTRYPTVKDGAIDDYTAIKGAYESRLTITPYLLEP